MSEFEFDLDMEVDDELELCFDSVIVVEGQQYPLYEGPTEVTPRKIETILETKDTIVKDDITVKPVTCLKVPNPAGGYTVTIAIE